MKRLALLLLFPSFALADVTASWVAPTTRVDGTPITAAEIEGYTFRHTIAGVVQPETFVVGTSRVISVTSQQVCVTVATVGIDGQQSDFTAQVCRKARPGKPTNLQVR
jgi:type IV secretory pathway protease TraF